MSTPEHEPPTSPAPPPLGYGQPGYGQPGYGQQGHGQQGSGYPGPPMPGAPPWAQYARPTGDGLGGIVALLIAVVFRLVPPFLLSNEVGQLYERRGQTPPVTALTGLWVFPGIVILVGPFIWFVTTNNALNEYWRGQGVTRTSLV